jgi:hypothetical protein
MEKLNIEICDKTTSLVKQRVQGTGVTIDTKDCHGSTSYRQKLTNVSQWSEDDLKVFEELKKQFGSFEEGV